VTAFPDSHTYLLDAEFAALTTIAANGIPQTTVVWFLHEHGELRLSLGTHRVKTRNLHRRPECSLLILDLANPHRYLDVRGRAALEPDPDYAFADRLGAKYGGTDLRSRDAPGESRVVVTMVPTNVYALP
jgi:PPOX class probable F420-dependent enzyme